MAQVVSHIYQFKRGKELDLEKANPFLRYGEPIAVYTTDGNLRLKIGDGINNYNDLTFLGSDEQTLLSYTSYFDFPNIGKRGVVYHAQDKAQLYQWDISAQSYNPITTETIYDYISGGNVAAL